MIAVFVGCNFFIFQQLVTIYIYFDSVAGLMLSLLVAFSWATLPLMSLFSYLFSNPSTSFTRISMFSVMTGKEINNLLLIYIIIVFIITL